MQRLLLTVPTLFGTEAIVSHEIHSLGYETVSVNDGQITFEGDMEAIALANISLRCGERVLIKMAEFRAETFDELFEGVYALPWDNFIQKDCAFPVKGNSLKSTLSSVPACQSIVKKAVVKRLSSKYGVEHFEETGPMMRIQFTLFKNTASIYLDTTGDPLYKRGYRTMGVAAPMRETLAFSMVDITRWRGDRPFADPFCGSGTFPIEAAMIAANIAPGMEREFTAENWSNLIGRKVWYNVSDEARSLVNLNIETDIQGYDADPEIIKIARENAEMAGVADLIHFQCRPVKDLSHPKPYGFIITNPPYGERMEEKNTLPGIYKDLGNAMKRLDTWSSYVITSYADTEKYIGKKATKNRKIYNGMLETRFYQFLGPKPPKKRGPGNE